MPYFPRTSAPRNWALLVGGLIVLYVLGLGPAVLIGAHDITAFRAMQTVYNPFRWAPSALKPAL